MKALNNIIAKAAADPRRIVLAEGGDPRVIEAAARATAQGLARVTLLGGPEVDIEALARELGHDLTGVEIRYPHALAADARYARALFELRRHKGMTLAQAQELACQPLPYANLMVRLGDADGVVAGAVHTTADVVRNAIQIIGVQPSFDLVSSFFLMMLCQPFHTLKGGLIFADCGLVVDPDERQLAQIALAAADSAASLLMEAPRVAMLSFSTSGSARHAAVDKVANAARRVRAQRPGLVIDGDVQLDAAIVAEISNQKVGDSQVKGNANVLIFPNLDAGNIGYKLAERVGGALAIGPLLQGLNRPANDLSRGCAANDIVNVMAVTVVQAQALAGGA